MLSTELETIRSQSILNGIYYAELNKFFSKELMECGYSSMKFLAHEVPVKIIVCVLKADDLINENRFRLKQITSLVKKRLKRDVVILVEIVKDRGLCPNVQAEYIRKKMMEGSTYRKAVNGALRTIKEAGAQGCTIIVSGKLKGQRARSQKLMWQTNIYSGNPKDEYMKEGKATVHLKQGVIGIIVRIMLPHDPEGRRGPRKEMIDKIKVLDVDS